MSYLENNPFQIGFKKGTILIPSMISSESELKMATSNEIGNGTRNEIRKEPPSPVPNIGIPLNSSFANFVDSDATPKSEVKIKPKLQSPVLSRSASINQFESVLLNPEQTNDGKVEEKERNLPALSRMNRINNLRGKKLMLKQLYL